MKKRVKPNLLVDGYRCRTVEDVREHFNLQDIMEHFKEGRLEKWMQRREIDKIEALQKIDKGLKPLELSKKLCELFDIEIDDSDIKNELFVYNYKLSKDDILDNKTIIKNILKEYKGNILNFRPVIKKIELRESKKRNIFSKDTFIIPLGLSCSKTIANLSGELQDYNGNIIKLNDYSIGTRSGIFNNFFTFSGLMSDLKVSSSFLNIMDNRAVSLIFLDLYDVVAINTKGSKNSDRNISASIFGSTSGISSYGFSENTSDLSDEDFRVSSSSMKELLTNEELIDDDSIEYKSSCVKQDRTEDSFVAILSNEIARVTNQ